MALLISWLAAPGQPAAPQPAGDGKIATALEEIEKERAATSSRSTAAERAAADLAARITALEQKSGGADQPSDRVAARVKSVEDRITALESADKARSAQPSATASNSHPDTVVALNRRIEALEQRIAALATRPVDPSAPSAIDRDGPARLPAPPAATAHGDNGVATQALRPPAPIPEPPLTAPAALVRGWVLHNVSGGVAVLEGRSAGVVEVRRGQNVAGLGRIISIDRRGSIWVVATERGVITAPAY